MNDQFERHTQKTSEGELYYELLNLYNFSPKESESVVETAKRCLVRDNILKEGEIEVSVVAIEEKSGKMIEKMCKTRVRLTIDSGKEDLEVLREYGREELRKQQIQRITEEAIEQGGVLSQEDLSKYLGCSTRTIKRAIKQIKEQAVEITTRGVLHNIGRGQTHKSRIIGLYLDGQTFSDIKLKTHHSVGAIKRYLQDFIKVLMSCQHRINDPVEISSVTGLSPWLVKQYLELIINSSKDNSKRTKIKSIISQWTRAGSRGLKKSLKEQEKQAFPTTGGSI